MQVMPKAYQPEAEKPHAGVCVQKRLTDSAGASPAGVIVRNPVTWMACRRETDYMEPIDKALLEE